MTVDTTAPGDVATFATAFCARVPFATMLGVQFARDDILGEPESAVDLLLTLPANPALIGNPMGPVLHGGASTAFLELTAQACFAWRLGWPHDGAAVPLPVVLSLSVDFLRPGVLQPAFARARIRRAGRRFATVEAWTWQHDPARPFLRAEVHFAMPVLAGTGGGA